MIRSLGRHTARLYLWSIATIFVEVFVLYSIDRYVPTIYALTTTLILSHFRLRIPVRTTFPNYAALVAAVAMARDV